MDSNDNDTNFEVDNNDIVVPPEEPQESPRTGTGTDTGTGTGTSMNTSNSTNAISAEAEKTSPLQSFLASTAKSTARNSWCSLCTSLLVALVLSGYGLVAGNFAIEVKSVGWTTRGTMISDRMTSSILLNRYSEYLRYGGEDAWIDMTTNIQPTWEEPAPPKDYQRPSRYRRGLLWQPRSLQQEEEGEQTSNNNDDLIADFNDLILRQTESDFLKRGCDQTIYFQQDFTQKPKLWPMWYLEDSAAAAENVNTLWHPKALLEMCKAEEMTQAVLEANDLCFGCEEGCLPPYSLVFIARLQVTNGLSLSCEDLSAGWEAQYESVVEQWKQCSADLLETKGSFIDALPESCPFAYSPAIVDIDFGETGLLDYSSSIFVTKDTGKTIKRMHKLLNSFGRGEDLVRATYDTQQESILEIVQDEALSDDLALSLGSALVIIVAMMVHTRSVFITSIGLLQILLSFPLSFFIYTLIGGYEFFPFFNFIGIFVVLALGADDVFVAVDKWKNARLIMPKASVEEVAAKALPDAAQAMFLTTLTTAVAFFATTICEVAPVKLFALFVGLLVILDYILCILFVFPALCIYDNAIQQSPGSPNCLCLMGSGATVSEEDVNADDDIGDRNSSMIRRALSSYYNILQSFRWPILAICAAAFGVSLYYGSTLDLPASLEVRLLPESIEQEENYITRFNLLSNHLVLAVEQSGSIIWGLTPADTGDQNNPYSFSSLVMDETFDPSTEENQVFLMEFCDDMFQEDFADSTEIDFSCPLKAVNEWLKSTSRTEEEESIAAACGDATGVPIPQDDFHSCVSAWAKYTDEQLFFFRQEKLVAILLPFRIRVTPNDSYETLRDEFLLMEDWMKEKLSTGNAGVEKAFGISSNFWFYDTHEAMLGTARQSAVIALAASAVVILFASRSLVLTCFSTLCILFVLASVTAIMVAMNWTLGFLESICFAILIGISADFVTHFSHAYVSPKGDVPRGKRTERALILMGPSVLAAAFTTGASAVVMIFTTILFFEKFAYVLFFSILQSTAAAFIVYCVLTVSLGPSHPTTFIDGLLCQSRK